MLSAVPPHTSKQASGTDTSATVYLSETDFLEHNETMWKLFFQNPHLGAQAMTEFVTPHIGCVSTALVARWLKQARTEDLPLSRLDLYRPCIEEWLAQSDAVEVGVPLVRFLKEDYNVSIRKQTIDRFLSQYEQLEGVEPLSHQALHDYDDWLRLLLASAPRLTPLQILCKSI